MLQRNYPPLSPPAELFDSDQFMFELKIEGFVRSFTSKPEKLS